MAPQITPPPEPLAPRQTDDPFASLSDLLASLTETDYMASYNAIYSSYLADMSSYGSLYPSFSVPTESFDVNSYLSSLTALTALTATRTNNPGNTDLPDPTETSAPVKGNADKNEKSGGLSQGAKIGIGVAVPLVVAILIGIGIFLWCAGKKKGKKNGSTTVVGAQPMQQQPQQQQASQVHVPQQQQNYPPNPQGYIQGFQQQQQVPPPPQYSSPIQSQQPPLGNNQMAYDGYYAKGPPPGVVEMEQEYHFARPGAVEMGDGSEAVVEKKGSK